LRDRKNEKILDVGGRTDIFKGRHPFGRAVSKAVVLLRGCVMIAGVVELDFIEELRLRRWARENYVPPDERSQKWHPVIHEEMEKKDGEEAGFPLPSPSYRWSNS